MKRKNKRSELAPIISNFLFHNSQDPIDEQKEYVELKIKIREYLGRKHFRTILADILFDLQKDVAGGIRERLFRLYVELGLHHDSYKKLSSWRWNTVSQGILELSQMKVPDAYHFISKFINDKRGIVRKQAEISIVSLNSEGINHLLDTTKYAISEWQQLKLIEALGNIENYRPPKFKVWLTSPNKDVVLFSLRLINHFNQNEGAESIAELVKHKNNDVKIAAVLCIKDFNFSKHLTILKKVFWKCSPIVKLQILETIGQIGDKGDLMFLHEIRSLESNFDVVSKAHGAINTISPNSILPTKDIVEDLVTPITKTTSGLYDLNFLEIEVDYTEVIIKDYEKIAPKEIEVDEIEVAELITISEYDKEEQSKVIAEKPDALIAEIEPELDVSLNATMGLIDTNVSDVDKDFTEIQNNYSEMSPKDRNKLVDTLESVGDERETQLLEFIMENEEDTELRFRAFNTLKQVSKLEIEENTASSNIEFKEEIELESVILEDIVSEHSIFYELFQYASDTNSKEILLKEIGAVGDKKEVPFLKELLKKESGTLKDLAKKALDHINKNIQESKDSSEGAAIPEDNHEENKTGIDEIDFNELQSLSEQRDGEPFKQYKTDDDRISLELFFLYDELGILYNKDNQKEDLGLNFQLAREFEIMVKSESLKN